MIDIIIIAIIGAVVGLAVGFIIKEKKRGKKCIGCPYSSCKSKCNCNSRNIIQGDDSNDKL